jgi:hypothetical protein
MASKGGAMSRFIPSTERITQAKNLIQKAREIPMPEEDHYRDFSYIAQVKDVLRQARELVKFIPYTSGLSPEIKEEAKRVIAETEEVEKDLLQK